MRLEPPPPRVSTTRLADPGHGPAIVGLLIVVFLATATLSSLMAGASAKVPSAGGSAAGVDPGASAAGGEAARATPMVSTMPPPTSEPSLRPGEIACMPAGWRLAYVGSVGSFQVETWLVVEPIAATDPLDSRIPVAELGHDVVAGLGACAPPAGVDGGGRPAVIERAWRVRPVGGSVVATPIGLVAPADAAIGTRDPRPDALALVRPVGDGATWAAGQYVLQIAPPGAVGQSRAAGLSAWLRIQLESPAP